MACTEAKFFECRVLQASAGLRLKCADKMWQA